MFAGLSVEAANGQGSLLRALAASNVNDRNVSIVALEGQDAPGTGSQYGQVYGSAANDNSEGLVFTADIPGVGDTFSAALYLAADPVSEPTLITLAGQPAPGVMDVNFRTLVVGVLNGPHLGYLASLSGNNIDNTNDGSVWFGPPSPGGQTLVLQEGQRVPDTADEVVFSEFYDIVVFDDGGVGINAAATSPEIPFGDSVDVFIDPNSSEIHKIAFIGDPVPGINGATFRQIGGANFSLAGHAQFWASMEVQISGSGLAILHRSRDLPTLIINPF